MKFEDFDIDFGSNKGADASEDYKSKVGVFKAKYKKTGEIFAIKIMPKPVEKDELNKNKRIYYFDPEEDEDKWNYMENKSYYERQTFEQEFQNEIYILKTLNCQNSVKYFAHFCTETDYYIVMELCDSDLKKYVEEEHQESFTSEEIREIFNQLNNVFKEMRKNNIMHRDLKLDNILIKNLDNGKKIFKLADFRSTDLSIKAPEISKYSKYRQPYNERCDLWSIGIMIYNIYFKKLPLQNYYKRYKEYPEYYKSFENIVPKSLNNMDLQLKDLLCRLLTINPYERISWNEYFNHPFFQVNENKQYTKIYDFNLGFNYNKDIFECFIAKDNKNNKNVLIKSYKNIFINNINNNALFNNEIYLFRQFKGNKNVINLIDEYYTYDRANLVFEFNDFEMLSIYRNKKEMDEKEINKINQILFQNVLIYNENINLLFNFISIHSFCFDKQGNPLLFDFGFHKLFLDNKELSFYFYPNINELQLYYINCVKTNVMNYGMTLLLLVCKNEIEFKDKEIILPKYISYGFNSFLSKCLYKNKQKRFSWNQLRNEYFLFEGNNELSLIFDKNYLLDNDKLEIILNSLKNRFEVIINYYDKFDVEKNIEYLKQIKGFLFITLFEIKLVINCFNNNNIDSLTNEKEISFISINETGEMNKFNINFGNPILKNTKVINMKYNEFIANFINEIKPYEKKLIIIIKKINKFLNISQIEMNYQNALNNIIKYFEDSFMQKYFFKLVLDGENEKDKMKYFNKLCLAEYLGEFILFIYSALYDEKETNYFSKEDFLKDFDKIFGDNKNNIELSFAFSKNAQSNHIIVSFIPIIFRYYKRKRIYQKDFFLNRDIINCVIQYFPSLMSKIIN